MRMELLLSVFAAVNGAAQAASVCEILNHRLDLNGKPVEISGTLSGGPLSGYFVCETKSCDPCVNRWIFSWPSAILLAPLSREREEELYARCCYTSASRLRSLSKGDYGLSPTIMLLIFRGGISAPWAVSNGAALQQGLIFRKSCS